jgi:SPP1 gp7 family putative phage head morphogenesis protein
MPRTEQLVEQLSDELRGLEDRAIARIGRIWTAALRDTVGKVFDRIEAIANEPEWDPEEAPGAFLGSTPDGLVPSSPEEKNRASLYLEGQLLQELRGILAEFPLTPRQSDRIDRELRGLFQAANDLGSEYAVELTREHLEPALTAVVGPPNARPEDWPAATYREGQRFTQLFAMGASVAAAQRDFRSLSENYRLESLYAANEHVRVSKAYYAKWWRRWGESVSFEAARQLAAGPDPRKLATALRKRIPTINEAFANRAEVVARTETLMALGEAQDRGYSRLQVGFVQYIATQDERICEWCAPRHGCIYLRGSVRTPIHPQCRCDLAPVTLEGLAIENAIAKDAAGTWENRAIAMNARAIAHFRNVNGPAARLRPIGGVGDARGQGDYPLMERTGLPQTIARRGLSGRDPLNGGAQAWPAADPVWCPRRGWLDPMVRAAYERLVAEASELSTAL